MEKITVLVGNNGCGKSAVLRALRFAALNEWDGEANTQIMWGEEECSVELGFEDHLVVRTKGKDSNLYVLDGEEYRAFGAGKVPDPIANALKLSKDSFQHQQDPAFWLSLTSGQAASALNEIFNLTQIDSALSNVASEMRTAKTRVEVSEERLAAARERKRDLDWAVGADKSLKQLESLLEKVHELDRERGRVEQIASEMERLTDLWNDAEKHQQNGQKLLEAQERILSLEDRIKNTKTLIKSAEEVTDLTEEYDQVCLDLKKKEQLLEKWLQGTCPLCRRG